jgi:hypothetical protein
MSARSAARVGQPYWSAVGGVEHGAQEVLAGGAIDPGGAQHDGVGQRGEYGLFAGQLARAINAGGGGEVGLDIGGGFGAVEDIVGGDMHQPGARGGAELGEAGRAGGVGGVGGVWLGLSTIDRCIGGGVEDDCWLDGGEGGVDRVGAVEVEIGAAG